MLRFDSAGRSHVGLVREHNEDAGFAGPTLQLVADGVGGAAAGEVASATAAFVTSALALAGAGSDPAALLHRSVDLVLEQLRIGTEQDARRAGMATTLTGLLTDGARTALVHVGDSRAYLLRRGALHRLTRDDTFVQMLVEEGVLTPDQARRHPQRNVVMRALDGVSVAGPDPVSRVDLEAGDRVLVCSDGLSDLVEEGEIARVLGAGDPDESAAALVDLALVGGGTDNVTTVVADVVDGPALQPDGLRLGSLADPRLVVDPGAVHAGHV